MKKLQDVPLLHETADLRERIRVLNDEKGALGGEDPKEKRPLPSN